MKQITVSLPRSQYQYSVYIGTEMLKESLNELLSHYSEKRLFVVTNDTIDGLYPDHILGLVGESIEVVKLVLPDGEQYKNFDCLQKILTFLAENRANRKSYLVAFGGGVIGDITGFAAAIYMRGISYIQVPTTLLSQVDSSIGGKTAVNHTGGKNFIGAFKQPLQTIIDVTFLKSLPRREFVAGYSELIKHGLISDGYLFQILSRKSIDELRLDDALLTDAIGRSCEVKARVVEGDETESYQRAVLNFGHTVAHFFETWTGYTKYLHGEAVIAGMDFAAWWSFHKSLIEKADFERIHKHLQSLGVKLEYKAPSQEEFLKLVGLDKKASGAGLKFIFLSNLGQAQIQEKVTGESIWLAYLEYLKIVDPLVSHVE